MPQGQPTSGGADSVSSWLSGSARDVVQARDISGGVHYHAPTAAPLPRPRQLPAEVPAFIGREREFGLLRGWTNSDTGGVNGGLVLIAGTAGVGKTSLAVGFAHSLRAEFPDGQLFVNLRGYDPGPPLAPDVALERFLRAFGVAPSAIPAGLDERAELYRTFLADRRVLVVLDNAATAGQVRPLLPGDSGCLVLVTTRGRLSGLSAREGAHRLTLGLLDQSDALALVRAITVAYRDSDPPEQLAELVDLCARLPLALRIVAERAAVRPLMPLRDLIGDLRGESSLWSALSVEDSVDADAVRSVFAWSYRVLPTAAAKAFRRLGLHAGPEFGLGAAAALIGDDHARTRALLDMLVGAHLLEQTAADRFQFHDLLRAYAQGQAHTDDTPEDQVTAVRRGIEWYLHTARAAVAATQSLIPAPALEEPDPALVIPDFDGPAQAMDWYVAERANLAAAVRAATDAAMPTLAWQIPATLFPIQAAHGALDDWLAMARRGLEAARVVDDLSAQAALLHSLGVALTSAREMEEAEACQSQALDLYAAIGDDNGFLRTANAIGLSHLRHRRLDQALAMFERTRALAVQQGARAWYAVAHDNLGTTYDAMGLPRKAAEHAQKALQHYRAAGAEGHTFVDPLLVLARSFREAGDLDQAAQHLDVAAEIMESGVVYRQLEYALVRERADQALARGDAGQALDDNWRCAALARELGDRSREALALDAMGRALLAQTRPEEAAEFHRTALATAPQLLNGFERALILLNLADALDPEADPDTIRSTRAEAADLLAGFTDPRAAARLEELTRRTT